MTPTINCGFLALLRQKIQSLKDSRLPSSRQEELLRRAEKLVLRQADPNCSLLVVEAVNREIMRELGIRE